MEKDLQIVGFRVGRETYGVPITTVHEIVCVPEITGVPDAPDYLEGVINLRGKLLGLVVDSASEVLKLTRSEIEAPPALVQEGRLNCVTGVAKLRGRLIILIDLVRLLPSSASQIPAEGEARSAHDPSSSFAALRAQAGGK